MIRWVWLAVLLSIAGVAHAERLLSEGEPFVLRELRFVGNTAFSDAELATLAEGLLNQTIAVEDLELLRVAVTKRYVAAGFVNSGAALDDQDVSDGIVELRVVEGALTNVVIDGSKRLRDAALAPRLLHAGQAPLNMAQLQNEIAVMNRDPNIRRINAELKPGAIPGEAWLHLAVEEAPAFHAAASFSNYRAPSVGAEHLGLDVWHTNLLGFGDRLRLSHVFTDGELDRLTLEPNNTAVSYAFPLGGAGATLTASVSRSDNTLVEEPFDQLSVGSESTSASLTYRQPILRTPQKEIGVFVEGGWRRAETFLLGQPFSFDAGADEGVTRLALVRLGGDYVRRSTEQVVAGRVTLTLGGKAFGARDVGQPNPTFAKTLVEGSWVRRFGDGWQLLGQGSAQWTAEKLPALERFSLGGRHTVRGFRENQLVRDRGIAGSIELRKSLPIIPERLGVVQGAVFLDAGWAENADGSDDPPHDLASAGVGILADLTCGLSAEAFYAAGFRSFDASERDLQDHGIHFRITYKFR